MNISISLEILAAKKTEANAKGNTYLEADLFRLAGGGRVAHGESAGRRDAVAGTRGPC